MPTLKQLTEKTLRRSLNFIGKITPVFKGHFLNASVSFNTTDIFSHGVIIFVVALKFLPFSLFDANVNKFKSYRKQYSFYHTLPVKKNIYIDRCRKFNRAEEKRQWLS